MAVQPAWPDGVPHFQRGRVHLRCPHCSTPLTLSPPTHKIYIYPATGVTVVPRFLCPECRGAAEVLRGQILRRGFRFPSPSPTLLPASLDSPSPPHGPRLPSPSPPPSPRKPVRVEASLPETIPSLLDLAKKHGVKTRAKTVQGLRAALQRAGVLDGEE